ncbi:hypothetical protein CONLIGDRAFT_448135 [Coniochaeta ligniaria NRRL 30616]|uniref:Uncharacterized protein n=1 Tax=Coniochaeta ligniaria NRRL 30616 TaxID=1408157 RepID=A0A1J7JEP5_9PEZI|nr:hypothetical protein CONLIGDRAFT_448135 [Coniochaeta ligniaria NRRL 30616]
MTFLVASDQSAMDPPSSLPGSPVGGPTALQPVSSDRVNQQRETMLSLRPGKDNARDSIVTDKISQFNSLTMQSKQLERKTADAALKRAMLGREEAETEMRRYREEARMLRKQVEEGKERERRVGERLETVMENYGRAKETHAHTQALWEKEIRRARKETFKSQSVIVKLQEELKSARSAVKSAEDLLDVEKERSKAREQEAFTSRYSLVGVQEQLEQALERVKMLEQERDAFKALAKNEEDIANLAAEGRLPLPSTAPVAEDDEFASPQKKSRVSSVSIADIKSSASSEAEIDELTMLWQWEKHRAERALEQVDFLQTECELKCCSCAKIHRQEAAAAASSPRRKRPEPRRITDASDLVILSEDTPAPPPEGLTSPSARKSKTDMLRAGEMSKGPRLSTIFVPTEGIFRTVSQEEAEALITIEDSESPLEAATVEDAPVVPPTPDQNPPYYARTPSVEPPDFAMLAKQRTSLLSLLDAPHGHHSHEAPLLFTIPTTPGPAPVQAASSSPSPAPTDTEEDDTITQRTVTVLNTATATTTDLLPEPAPAPAQAPAPYYDEAHDRPHTAAAFYTSTTVTTTTKIPLKDENEDPSLAARILAAQRTPKKAGGGPEQPSFDVTNPALTPTMTREQALAQIRERRARSGGAAVTPRKQMVEGGW